MTEYLGKPLGLVIETNDQYHSHTASISKSHLDAIAGKSPKHYWHRYIREDREPNTPTPAMVLGSAIHSAILEPDLFPLEYVANPGIERRSNAGKAEYAAFEAENKGKTVLSDDDFQTCLSMRDAVHMHPVAAGLFTGGNAEQSFYAIDEETGELMKCRTDYMHGNGMIVDLKSTEDASQTGFSKSAGNFRYDVQVAWYHGVLDAAYGEHNPVFAFVAVEKSKPHALGIYYATPIDIEIALKAARADFLRIVEHKRSGLWPDYGDEARPLIIPKYVKR